MRGVSGNPGLHLYTSNRLEQLAAALATILRRPLRDPFAAEPLVVPSLGLERWLTQQLALRQGICANVSFLFPQIFVAGLMDAALPGRAGARFFARDNLTWRIMKLLPALASQPEFAELRRYLELPRPALRRFQLAGKIAGSFDQYLAYRPRMILEWDGGAGTDWQPILWRALAESAPGLHPPALAKEFSAAMQCGAAALLPERISVFGVSTMPPFYLQFFQELAQSTEVHLFVMQPTPEWWSDSRSDREVARSRRRASASAQLDLDFAPRLNPLLASFGKLGREFLESVTELEPRSETEKFEPPPNDSMLGQIQHDIFQLHDPTGTAPGPVAPDDRSLQFHSCHSPMREMEVLHDQLLALFEQQPDLKPHDVVVMAPDIATYAPFVEAVFGTGPERLRIPFSIADRGARAENGIIDTFLRILEAAGGRFTASSVMSILESTPLQRKFDLVETDLETIRVWIEEAGIRWGIDAAQRGELGLPEFGENSWRTGLDRLLLGYGAPAHGEKLFAGILAYDKIEGSLAETLGHFAEFTDALFTTARGLQEPRTLTAWEETLHQISAQFFVADDEREPELRQLRNVIEALGETARLSEFDDPVPLDVLIAHLEQSLDNKETNSGFLVGRVTFCALKPMRTVPFRVVCLLGMNDTAFPRHSRAPGFDLIAQNPRRGDRSTRDDDRYLFLEALLSARDVFLVSYVGRSSRDNNAIPPSVLVSELLDYARSRFALDQAAPLVTEHRLQPFSPAYFQGENGLFSYSTENAIASEVAAAGPVSPLPFVSTPISEPEPEWRQVGATQLISFFGNPAKFFSEKRLALRVPRLEELLDDSEPLEIGSLPKYHLQQDLLTRVLRGESLETLLPVLRADGQLPPGHAGAARLNELCVAAERFAALVREKVSGPADEPRTVALAIDDFQLSAQLDKLYGGRQVHYRLTTRKPKDLLTAWINHLAANSTIETETLLITVTKKNEPVVGEFGPTDPKVAVQHLRQLLQFYWEGLRAPLPFFPKSSLEFAKKMRTDDLATARKAACKKWEKEPGKYDDDKGEPPEKEDTYFRVAFRNVPQPLDDQFETLSTAIFGPILEAMKE